MEIKTRFSIGDTVWKIGSSGKVTQFEVRHIGYDGAVYYGTCHYDLTLESQCFASKEELIAYVTSDE